MRWSWLKNILPNSNKQRTIEIRHLVEDGVEIFDSCDKYPIWNENHRAELEKKILDHYWCRQIGFETFGRFKHELNTRMREIMPYYNQLYKTTLFEYNPIENYNMEERFEDTSKGSEASNSKGQSEHVNRYSETPQGSITNIDDGWLTNLTKDNGNSEGESSSTSEQNTVHKGGRHGNIGVTTTQQMIEQERNIILNIDKLIIDELQDLFLGVF